MPSNDHPEPAMPVCITPKLPDIRYVTQPPSVRRFQIQIYPNGHIRFKGSREDIERFCQSCAERALDLQLDNVSLCG